MGHKPICEFTISVGEKIGKGVGYCSPDEGDLVLEVLSETIQLVICSGVVDHGCSQNFVSDILAWNPLLRKNGTAKAEAIGICVGLSVETVCCAISAIDSALWDLRAQQVGVSLTELIEAGLREELQQGGAEEEAGPHLRATRDEELSNFLAQRASSCSPLDNLLRDEETQQAARRSSFNSAMGVESSPAAAVHDDPPRSAAIRRSDTFPPKEMLLRLGGGGANADGLAHEQSLLSGALTREPPSSSPDRSVLLPPTRPALDGDLFGGTRRSYEDFPAPLAYCTTELPYFDLLAPDLSVEKLRTQRGEMLADISLKLAHLTTALGFRAIKVYSSSPSFGNFGAENLATSHDAGAVRDFVRQYEFELIGFVRSCVGPDVHLMFDCGAYRPGWVHGDVEWACRLDAELKRHNYLWNEEPCRLQTDYTKIAEARALAEEVRRYRSGLFGGDKGRNGRRKRDFGEAESRAGAAPVLAGGEAILGVEAFRALFEGGGVGSSDTSDEQAPEECSMKLIQPDATVAGGLSVLVALRALAWRHGAALVPHGYSTLLGFRNDCCFQSAVAAVARGQNLRRGKGFDEDVSQLDNHIFVELPEHVLGKNIKLRRGWVVEVMEERFIAM